MKKSVILAIAVAVILVAGAVFYYMLPKVAPLEVAYVSQKADLTTLDVQAAVDAPTLIVLTHVYETLIKMDVKPDGTVTLRPLLAESYRMVGDTLWEFKLRPNVKFHDGTPLTSEAVKISFERGPTVGAIPKILLAPVDKVEVIDALTFRILLKFPFLALDRHLAHPSAAIVHPRIKGLTTADITPDKVVGTGPFRFAEYVKGERTVLKAFEDYWGEKATIKTLVWRPIADDPTRMSALEAGDLHIATHIPPEFVSVLKGKGFKIESMPSVRLIFIGINNEKIPDPRVRQAFNLAVNKAEIVEKILGGQGKVADAPFAPGVFAYKPIETPVYDPARARKLLEEAKWPMDRKLTFIAPAGRYLADRQIAEAVHSYLVKLGLNVELKILEFATLIKEGREGNFDLILLGWSTATMDADYALYSLFHTKGGFNWWKYKSERVDELLVKAKEETNVDRRISLYHEAMAIIMKEAPFIFLHFEPIILSTQPFVKGVEILPIERWILTYVVLERIGF